MTGKQPWAGGCSTALSDLDGALLAPLTRRYWQARVGAAHTVVGGHVTSASSPVTGHAGPAKDAGSTAGCAERPGFATMRGEPGQSAQAAALS